jgi:hypothetical protein
MAAVLTRCSISRMTVTVSLLCLSTLVMMTMMEELRVPAKGVQQGGDLYRFIRRRENTGILLLYVGSFSGECYLSGQPV